jgi:hypothetical protein
VTGSRRTLSMHTRSIPYLLNNMFHVWVIGFDWYPSPRFDAGRPCAFRPSESMKHA